MPSTIIVDFDVTLFAANYSPITGGATPPGVWSFVSGADTFNGNSGFNDLPAGAGAWSPSSGGIDGDFGADVGSSTVSSSNPDASAPIGLSVLIQATALASAITAQVPASATITSIIRRSSVTGVDSSSINTSGSLSVTGGPNFGPISGSGSDSAEFETVAPAQISRATLLANLSTFTPFNPSIDQSFTRPPTNNTRVGSYLWLMHMEFEITYFIGTETLFLSPPGGGSFGTGDGVGDGGFDAGGATEMLLLVNPSGIYALTPGLTHDTYYLDSETDGDTIDVKIPDPLAITGFLGG